MNFHNAPHLVVGHFFSAPGEKGRYRKMAGVWFVVMNLIGLLLQSAFYYFPSFRSANTAISIVFIVLFIVPPVVLIVIAARKP